MSQATLNSKPKTAKAQKTRARILASAKHVFASKGFNKTSAQDISKAADLGYGTFYLYFKDKKSVFYALVEQVEDELYTAAQGGSDLQKDYAPGASSYRALRKDLKAIFESFLANKDVINICRELAITDPEFKTRYIAMRQRLVKRTEQILEKSDISKVNHKVAAVAISGMIEAVANEWAENQDSWNFDDIIPTITKLYFKAVV